MTLPELPEPCNFKVFGHPFDYYTEAQMLALRAATVEACAAVCADLYEETGRDLEYGGCVDAEKRIRGLK